MSRLDEIKGRYMQHEYDFALSSADTDYLIQQAERVKELENKIKITEFFNELYKKRATELEISRKEIAETVKKEYLQNKRYKQALEEILGLDIDVSIYDYSGDVITIAAEALKGDKP